MLYEHASKSDDGDAVELSEFSLFSTLCTYYVSIANDVDKLCFTHKLLHKHFEQTGKYSIMRTAILA